MNIDIDKMNMVLPSGFSNRAEEIARLIADYLSRKPFSSDIKMEHIQVPAIKVQPGQDNHSIAASIADSIFGQINSSHTVIEEKPFNRNAVRKNDLVTGDNATGDSVVRGDSLNNKNRSV